MSVNGELTKANVLTVAKVQESELQHSSSGTPTHSPPFNTSSESGDSGCYSLVGKYSYITSFHSNTIDHQIQFSTELELDRWYST